MVCSASTACHLPFSMLVQIDFGEGEAGELAALPVFEARQAPQVVNKSYKADPPLAPIPRLLSKERLSLKI